MISDTNEQIHISQLCFADPEASQINDFESMYGKQSH
jgi:hypothetical protein